MFFEAHSEGKIGYKRLTDADLGRARGNITHIGLFDDILTFLPDHYEGSSMFLYEDNCDILDLYFDRIENPDGTFRSPKIKKGGKNAVSVVTVIQDVVKDLPLNLKWYLVWFGLKSRESVFVLFNDQSEHYRNIMKCIDLSNENVKGRISSEQHGFQSLISYLESVVNHNGSDIIRELETISQTGVANNYRPFDIEKANLLFKETGRAGEELVAEYLKRLKHQGDIVAFSWLNQSQESGLPYDFKIQEQNQNIIHVDVKATSFGFEQPMIFSNQEINFIQNIPCYQIFRVYDLSEPKRHLRICSNSKEFISNLNAGIINLQTEVRKYNVELQSVKLAIPPINAKLLFKPKIIL